MSSELPDRGDAFLGRFFVLIVLVAAAAVLLACMAADQVMIGFLGVEAIVALALTLRYTWERRNGSGYAGLITLFVALHVVAIAAVYRAVARGPGAAFMLVALVDAIAMTLVINTLIPGNGGAGTR